MTDAERTAMMKKMDEQLEEHFRKLEEKAKLRDPNQRMEGAKSQTPYKNVERRRTLKSYLNHVTQDHTFMINLNQRPT